jgi:pentatricopeptide repeat protein
VSSQQQQQQQDAQERRKAESLERGHHPLMSLNLNLDSLAQGGAGDRALELLERIEALFQEGYYSVSPDICSWNTCLKAFKNDPQKALALLKSLEQRSQDIRQNSNENNIQPNIITYNTVIHCFAQNGLYQEAEELLREMLSEGQVLPDTTTWNTVLHAHAQSKDVDAPSKAEDFLREMITDENEAQVDTTSFNIVIHAWAKQSKQDKGPRRALGLLEHMEKLSSAGNGRVKPDSYTYATVIEAFVSQLRDRRRRHDQRSRGSQFDKGQSTRTLCTNTETGRTVIELLKKMEIQQLQPSHITFTSVMSALCWTGKPQEAHDLLLNLLAKFEEQQEIAGSSSSAQSMLVKPDTIMFSNMMDGWVKNFHNFPKYNERVLELLGIMKHWQANGHDDMAPNGRTYTSVLTALAKSRTWDACIEARSLLNEIPGGPSVIHFNVVLDAFSKSPRADKGLHAKALLEEMTADASIDPDAISYNSVLSACAGSFGSAELRQETLGTAMAVFKHICQSEDFEPSPYTFSVMIKALRKLIPDDEQRCIMVSKIFKICIKHGMLNPGVWQQVQKSIPQSSDTKELWGQMIGEELYRPGVQLSELPKEWKLKAKAY